MPPTSDPPAGLPSGVLWRSTTSPPNCPSSRTARRSPVTSQNTILSSSPTTATSSCSASTPPAELRCANVSASAAPMPPRSSPWHGRNGAPRASRPASPNSWNGCCCTRHRSPSRRMWRSSSPPTPATRCRGWRIKRPSPPSPSSAPPCKKRSASPSTVPRASICSAARSSKPCSTACSAPGWKSRGTAEHSTGAPLGGACMSPSSTPCSSASPRRGL